MISQEQATVWRGHGRRYFTKRAAIKSVAVALIKKRHPTEREESDEFGRTTNPGFHWTEIPRWEILLRRVMRLVEKSMEKQS